MAQNPEAAKRVLGVYGAGQVEPGMVLGIGSGTTVDAFIDALGERLRNAPFALVCVAASKASVARARAAGLPIQAPESIGVLDLAVDGADRVNPERVMIKGGGAALVRERLVMSQARRALILVDSTKLAPRLQQVTVPLAILPFAWPATLARIQEVTPEAYLRQVDGHPVMTDDGLYLVDAHVDDLPNPEDWHATVKMLPGVVDTGIFAGFPADVVVSDGEAVWPLEPRQAQL